MVSGGLFLILGETVALVFLLFLQFRLLGKKRVQGAGGVDILCAQHKDPRELSAGADILIHKVRIEKEHLCAVKRCALGQGESLALRDGSGQGGLAATISAVEKIHIGGRKGGTRKRRHLDGNRLDQRAGFGRIFFHGGLLFCGGNNRK